MKDKACLGIQITMFPNQVNCILLCLVIPGYRPVLYTLIETSNRLQSITIEKKWPLLLRLFQILGTTVFCRFRDGRPVLSYFHYNYRIRITKWGSNYLLNPPILKNHTPVRDLVRGFRRRKLVRTMGAISNGREKKVTVPSNFSTYKSNEVMVVITS